MRVLQYTYEYTSNTWVKSSEVLAGQVEWLVARSSRGRAMSGDGGVKGLENLAHFDHKRTLFKMDNHRRNLRGVPVLHFLDWGVRVRWGGEYFLPILLSFHLGTQGRLVFLLNWYPPLLDQSYAPVDNTTYSLTSGLMLQQGGQTGAGGLSPLASSFRPLCLEREFQMAGAEWQKL